MQLLECKRKNDEVLRCRGWLGHSGTMYSWSAIPRPPRSFLPNALEKFRGDLNNSPRHGTLSLSVGGQRARQTEPSTRKKNPMMRTHLTLAALLFLLSATAAPLERPGPRRPGPAQEVPCPADFQYGSPLPEWRLPSDRAGRDAGTRKNRGTRADYARLVHDRRPVGGPSPRTGLPHLLGRGREAGGGIAAGRLFRPGFRPLRRVP